MRGAHRGDAGERDAQGCGRRARAVHRLADHRGKAAETVAGVARGRCGREGRREFNRGESRRRGEHPVRASTHRRRPRAHRAREGPRARAHRVPPGAEGRAPTRAAGARARFGDAPARRRRGADPRARRGARQPRPRAQAPCAAGPRGGGRSVPAPRARCPEVRRVRGCRSRLCAGRLTVQG